MIEKVNLQQKFGKFSDHWSPKLVAEIDDYHIKLAKVEGEFVWHKHDDEDEMFMVINGQLTIELRDQDDIVLNAGEFVVIPRGVEHRPVTEDECQLMLFERGGLVNTGDAEESELTATVEQI